MHKNKKKVYTIKESNLKTLLMRKIFDLLVKVLRQKRIISLETSFVYILYFILSR